MQNSTKSRKSILPPDSEFVTRWSPRSFDVSYKIPPSDLDLCFEAARWSYSSRNLQPWTFIYGLNKDETFKTIFNSLVEFNQNWAKNCSALVLLTMPEEVENLFDCGAAAMSFSLQAQKLGLHTHVIGGFEKEKIKPFIKDTPVCVIAVGKMGNLDELDDFNKKREIPSDRKSLDQIRFSSFDKLN